MEASLWLLRSCGKYDRAIDVLKERMDNPNRSIQGGWSYTKYENYTTDLLKELWSSKNEESANLALISSSTQQILENNPTSGLSIFTSSHPQNQKQWRDMKMNDDPLLHVIDPLSVVNRLKSIQPSQSLGAIKYNESKIQSR